MSQNLNYSTLQRNTLDGLSETAGCLYLKLLDTLEAHRSQHNERIAFLIACRYDSQVGGVIDYILRHFYHLNKSDPETFAILSQFFSERWRNNFMEKDHGQNRNQS